VIPAIVLAAGKSTRMGRAKALLPLEPGETFLTRIVRTLRDAEVEDVVVVVGHEPESILTTFAGQARVVINADYEAGQLTSLLAGLRLVDRPGVIAVLVTLVDVPLVTTATVRAVIERYRRTGVPIVRPVHNGRHGHPVLIDRSLFDRIRAADPTIGLKPIVRAHASAAGDVEVADEGAFRDIDTPAEYDRVRAELGRC
jgi:molybdenum cofactor cytidylyltransferase